MFAIHNLLPGKEGAGNLTSEPEASLQNPQGAGTSARDEPGALGFGGASNYCARLHSRAYTAASTACGGDTQLHTPKIFWIIYLRSAGQRAVRELQLQLCRARYSHAVSAAKNSSGALQLLPERPGQRRGMQDLPQPGGPQQDRCERGNAQGESCLCSRSNPQPGI